MFIWVCANMLADDDFITVRPKVKSHKTICLI